MLNMSSSGCDPKADIDVQNSNMLYLLLSGGTYSAERPVERTAR
jgi:hypothetical protein